MKTQKSQIIITAAFVLLLIQAAMVGCAGNPEAGKGDPLASWNEGGAREAVIDFVVRVTDEGSADFVPESERIAVFDNDGTLWSEQPVYFQVMFIFDRIKQLAPQHPEWRETEPFASALKDDINAALAGGEHAILEMVMTTHAGMTTDAFAKSSALGLQKPGTHKPESF